MTSFPVNALQTTVTSPTTVDSPIVAAADTLDRIIVAGTVSGIIEPGASDLQELALRPKQPALQATSGAGAPPPVPTEVVSADKAPALSKAVAKPIKRLALSDQVKNDPAYLGMWEAIRTNDVVALRKHLDALTVHGTDVLRHTLTHEVLDLGAFAPQHAPASSALHSDIPPTFLSDPYTLIVNRARRQSAEEAMRQAGPGRPASIAAALGHAAVLQEMLRRQINICNLNEQVMREEGKTLYTPPAFWAAYFGHAECLDLMRNHGVALEPVREVLKIKAEPATVSWLRQNDSSAREFLERALLAAIQRSLDPEEADSAIEDLRSLVQEGKLVLTGSCGRAPHGWLAVALPAGNAAKPAYRAAAELLRLGACPPRSGAGNAHDLFRASIIAGDQNLLRAWLEMDAARRKKGSGEGLVPVSQPHLMAAIESKEPQPTYAQLYFAGFGPNNHEEAQRQFEAAHKLELTHITELLQIQYRLLKDREGRLLGRRSTHQKLDPQAVAAYRARCDEIAELCRQDAEAPCFEEMFSGDPQRDLCANLDTAPEHPLWGLRPALRGLEAMGRIAKRAAGTIVKSKPKATTTRAAAQATSETTYGTSRAQPPVSRAPYYTDMAPPLPPVAYPTASAAPVASNAVPLPVPTGSAF